MFRRVSSEPVLFPHLDLTRSPTIPKGRRGVQVDNYRMFLERLIAVRSRLRSVKFGDKHYLNELLTCSGASLECIDLSQSRHHLSEADLLAIGEHCPMLQVLRLRRCRARAAAYETLAGKWPHLSEFEIDEVISSKAILELAQRGNLRILRINATLQLTGASDRESLLPLASLESLSIRLRDWDWFIAFLEAIAGSGSLKLRRLRLYGPGMWLKPQEMVEAIGKCATTLEELIIENYAQTEWVIRLTGVLVNLRKLKLAAWTRIDLRAMTHLQHLHLEKVTDHSLAELSTNLRSELTVFKCRHQPPWGALAVGTVCEFLWAILTIRKFSVCGWPMTQPVLENLAHCTELRHLRINHCEGLTSVGLLCLTARDDGDGLVNLRKLEVSSVVQGGMNWAMLHWPLLEVLRANHPSATFNAGATRFLSRHPRLTKLSVAGPGLVKSNLTALSRCPLLRSLEFSEAEQLDDRGLMAISKCARLRRLSLRACPLITPEGLAQLMRAAPKILRYDISACQLLRPDMVDLASLGLARVFFDEQELDF
jgi:hypothetical protein